MLGDCLCWCHGLAIASQVYSERPSLSFNWEVTLWVESGLMLSLASMCTAVLVSLRHTHAPATELSQELKAHR